MYELSTFIDKKNIIEDTEYNNNINTKKLDTYNL